MSQINYKGYKLTILKWLKDLRDHSPEGEHPFGGWVLAGKIRSIDTPFGFIGFRGDRDVRDLIKEGLLEADYFGKLRVVRYRYPKPLSPAEQKVEIEQRLLEATR